MKPAYFNIERVSKRWMFFAFGAILLVAGVGAFSRNPGTQLRVAISGPAALPDAHAFFDVGQPVWKHEYEQRHARGAAVRTDGSVDEILLFDIPPSKPGRITLVAEHPAEGFTIRSAAVVVATTGREVAFFELHRAVALQACTVTPNGRGIAVVVNPGSRSAAIGLPIPAHVRPSLLDRTIAAARLDGQIIATIAIVAAFLLVARSCRKGGQRSPHTRVYRSLEFWRQLEGKPRRTVILCATVAAILSSYPVVFFGRSYVSPDNGNILLYHAFPTLPGYRSEHVEDMKGSDLAALFLDHVPYVHVERQSLVKYGETPLWDRYNYCGNALLGQGQSMFGEPLSFLVTLCDSAAWAWDAKFVAAKILFASVLGLVVLELTISLPAALLLAFSSPFIGFFAFRFNHAAFFSLCYAPGILYCWLRLLRSGTWGGVTRWSAALIVADWIEMTSGTVKEAYMLLLSINFCGLIMLLVSAEPWRRKARYLLAAASSGLCFACLSSPIWVTLVRNLGQSFSSYADPPIGQVSPRLFIGAFDDLFYRELVAHEGLLLPSANFLILLGVLLAIAGFWRLKHDRRYVGILLSALLPVSLIFGFIPPTFIRAIPFLKNVGHIHNTFTCVLIIHAVALAGCGFSQFLKRTAPDVWWRQFTIVISLLAMLLALYFTYSDPTTSFAKSRFFYGYLITLLVASCFWLLLSKVLVEQHSQRVTVFFLWFACILLLQWRHAAHVSTPFDDYVQNPQRRVSLRASSPAIEWMKTRAHEPFRAIGFGFNLFPGWTSMYDVESPFAADGLIPKYFRELATAEDLPIIWGWCYVIDPDGVGQHLPFLSMVNTRYIVGLPGTSPPVGDNPRARSSADLVVYENTSYWARAFFTTQVTITHSLPELITLLHGNERQPFAAFDSSEVRQHPVVAALSLQSHLGSSPALDYSLTNNTTSFTVNASAPGIAVLTETYMDDDFRATVNGRLVSYLRVNHAFKGIALDHAGVYRISFTYWPKYMTACLWSAAAAFLAIIAAVAISPRFALHPV